MSTENFPSDGVRRSRSTLPRLVVVLGIVSLLTDLSSEMILPLLPALLLGTLGASPVIVGLVDGIADALSAVLKLVAGRLSDGRARKPFVVFGYALSTVVRPLMSIAGAPWHVVAVRAVDRVGKGFRSAPRDALIADVVTPADAPRAYAFHRLMDHTGAIFGPLVASALLFIGLTAREAIAAAWIPGALAVLALIVFVREPPRAQPELARAVTVTSSAGTAKPRVPLPAELRRLLVMFAVFSCGVAGDTFVLVRARDLHVDDAVLPLIWAVLHVAKVIAAAAVGRANTSSPRVLVGAWLAVAAGLALLVVDAPWIVWIGAIVIGVGHGAREPIEKSLVRALAPDESRGRAFGTYHLVTGLGALPAGLLIGLAWDKLDGRIALSGSAAVVVVATALLCGLLVVARRGTSRSNTE